MVLHHLAIFKLWVMLLLLPWRLLGTTTGDQCSETDPAKFHQALQRQTQDLTLGVLPCNHFSFPYSTCYTDVLHIKMECFDKINSWKWKIPTVTCISARAIYEETPMHSSLPCIRNSVIYSPFICRVSQFQKAWVARKNFHTPNNLPHKSLWNIRNTNCNFCWLLVVYLFITAATKDTLVMCFL